VCVCVCVCVCVVMVVSHDGDTMSRRSMYSWYTTYVCVCVCELRWHGDMMVAQCTDEACYMCVCVGVCVCVCVVMVVSHDGYTMSR